MSGPRPPAAAGVRADWPQVPGRMRTAVEDRLGSKVESATSSPGGFSPGVAARLRASDGRRVFVKAVGPEPNPGFPAAHRREVKIAAALPPDVPAPRLLWSYDEGEDGWIVLAFEDVEGRKPEEPWRPDELDRVLDALAALAGLLTPSPLPQTTVGARESGPSSPGATGVSCGGSVRRGSTAGRSVTSTGSPRRPPPPRPGTRCSI
jgi:hypothetical protein